MNSTRKGIDVSSHQGIIDWAKVKSFGIEFAMIRAGYATSIDKYFTRNITMAKDAGIKCGVYLYSYASDKNQAIKEALFLVKTLKEYNLQYPVAFDIEDNEAQGQLTNDQRDEIVVAFMTEIEKSGYYSALYSSKYWLETKFGSKIDKYDKWVAQWNVEKPNYEGNTDIWQYTSTGSVNGISGYVDMNISYKDYASIIPGGDDMTLESAIKVLIDKGIVNTPDYWMNAIKCVKYLDQLIINAAEALEK